LTEVRKVQRDALVSFDGVRYGVPWQYSGREVVVRQRDCTIDILFDDHVIAMHQKRYTSRSTCYLAVGLSVEALSRGISMYFTTLTRMIEDLKKHARINP